jgi:hypothetical protein
MLEKQDETFDLDTPKIEWGGDKTLFNTLLEPLHAKRDGDRYKARCPAHDDSSPSLSLIQFDSGVISVNCFAGCKADALAKALNLNCPYTEGDNGCLIIPPGEKPKSGSREQEKRTEFARLLRESEQGNFTAVICYNLSRFGRLRRLRDFVSYRPNKGRLKIGCRYCVPS